MARFVSYFRKGKSASTLEGYEAADFALTVSSIDTANSPNANEFARFTDANTIEGRTASETRSDLSLVVGTNVQAYSANLDEYAAVNPTAAGLDLLDDADNTAQRTTLGLGTLATQNGTFSGTSSGTNTGDQTSIVGITGTKAQFDTAVTDGNILYVGDAPTAHADSHKLGGSDVILLNEFGNPTASVEFNQQQALQFRLENRTSDPGSPANGECWLRTDL